MLPYLDLPANPAAVLGYSPSLIELDQPNPLLAFNAGRYNAALGSMELSIKSKDHTVRTALEAVASLADAIARIGWAVTDGGELRADRVPFDDVLQVMGILYGLGFRFHSQLANLQAQAEAYGVSPATQAAYDVFLGHASGFLQQVQSLMLTPLDSRKGIRQIAHPQRAVAVMHYSSAVFVTPDPHEPNFVCVTLRGLSRNDKLTLRTLAYDYFGQVGLRVQLYEN